jgi:hypothetical protein
MAAPFRSRSVPDNKLSDLGAQALCDALLNTNKTLQSLS